MATGIRFAGLLALTLFLAGGSPMPGARLEVVLIPQAGASGTVSPGGTSKEVEIELRVDRSDQPPLRGRAGLATPQTFQVGEGTWTVEARAPGLWAPPRTVTLDKDGARRIEIGLYDASSIQGKVQVEKGDALPAEIGVELHPPASLPGPANPRPIRPAPSEALAFRCPVQDGSFECPAPAGEWDVRLRAPDRVSHYLWKRSFPQGSQAVLGSFLLRRGASVVGWARAEGTVPKGREIQVSLQPLNAAPSAGFESARQALTMSTKADERGFFHLAGIAPGAYLLTASLEGFSTAKFFPLQVVENRESQLREPLVLGPPVHLEVRVDPPSDLHQKPWEILVFDLGDVPGTMEQAAQGRTGTDGVWKVDGLPSGRLLVQLQDAAGSPWAFQELEAVAGDSLVDFALDLVEVEGRLRLGGEPLAAALYFGGKMGVPSFRFQSDEDGRFHGYLAKEGAWPIQIEAQDPPVRRSLAKVPVSRLPGKQVARVDLDLPAGMLRGRVTDEQDRPVAQAQVMVQIPEDAPIHTQTGDKGEFEAHGFGSGDIWVQARAEGKESEAQWLHFVEGSEPSLHLVLRPKREVTGWVLGPAGGIPGAQVLATAPGEIRSQAVTDAAGRFVLRVPAAAASLDVVILPPGHSLQVRRVTLTPEEDLRLAVEPEGGTLVLNGLDGEGRNADSTVLMARNGVPVSLAVLRNWSESNGRRWAASETPLVPALGAGHYEVCRVLYRQLPARLQGDRSVGRCATGVLVAGGELSLEVPRVELSAGK